MGKLHFGNEAVGTAAMFQDVSKKLMTPTLQVSTFSEEYFIITLDSVTKAYADTIKFYNEGILLLEKPISSSSSTVRVEYSELGKGLFSEIRIQAAGNGFIDSDLSTTSTSVNICEVTLNLTNMYSSIGNKSKFFTSVGVGRNINIYPDSGYYLPETITVVGTNNYSYDDITGNIYFSAAGSNTINITAVGATENKLRTPTLTKLTDETFQARIPYGSKQIKFYDADNLTDDEIKVSTPFFTYEKEKVVPSIEFLEAYGPSTETTDVNFTDLIGITDPWTREDVIGKQIPNIGVGDYIILRYNVHIPKGWRCEDATIYLVYDYFGNGHSGYPIYWTVSMLNSELGRDSNPYSGGTNLIGQLDSPGWNSNWENYNLAFSTLIGTSGEGDYFLEVKIAGREASANISCFQNIKIYLLGSFIDESGMSYTHSTMIFDLNTMSAPKGLNTVAAIAIPDENIYDVVTGRKYENSNVSNRILMLYKPLDYMDSYETKEIVISGASVGIKKLEIQIGDADKIEYSSWEGFEIRIPYSDYLSGFAKIIVQITTTFENGKTENKTLYIGGAPEFALASQEMVSQVSRYIEENSLTPEQVADEIGWNLGDEIILDTFCPDFNESYPIPYKIIGINHDRRDDGSPIGISLMAMNSIYYGRIYGSQRDYFEDTMWQTQLSNCYLTDPAWSNAQQIISKTFHFYEGEIYDDTEITISQKFVPITAYETDCGTEGGFEMRHNDGTPYEYFQSISTLPLFKRYPFDNMFSSMVAVIGQSTYSNFTNNRMYMYGDERAKSVGLNSQGLFIVSYSIHPIIAF